MQRASTLQNDFFYRNKNATYLRILIISLSVLVMLFLYVVFYRARRLSMNLILTAAMVVLMILSFNSLGVLFTNFSINVEICEEAIKVFDESYGDITFRVNHNFNEFLTCFNFETKNSLKNQMMAGFVASNSVLTILKNFFYVEDQTMITKGFFDSTESVEEHKSQILERLEEVEERGDSDSYILMQNYLEVLQILNNLYEELDSLISCDNLRAWADRINKNMCRAGLTYQFISGLAFLGKSPLLESVIYMLLSIQFTQYICQQVINHTLVSQPFNYYFPKINTIIVDLQSQNFILHKGFLSI